MSHYRLEEERPGADIPREELDDEAGCLFPGRCAVAGLHTPASCFVPQYRPLEAERSQEIRA